VSGGAWKPPTFVRLSIGLHAAGAATLALAPERWPWVLGGVLLDHAAIGIGVLSPRSALLGANLVRTGARAAVSLTFDDGPDPEVTPAVLEILERRRARATFFCVGQRVAAHPDLAAEAHRRGHRVENHTFSHPHTFAFQGPGAMTREVVRAQEAIARATGRAPALFRAPVGFRNPWLDGVLHRAGLALVSWTRRGLDTVRADAAGAARRLLRGAAAGDILLLHDGSSARDGQGRAIVLDALERVLDGLEAAGLRSVPIDHAG
jgi:peptidoglycan/xylan/chitin deacetylase (PgdA/CDA1 family)